MIRIVFNPNTNCVRFVTCNYLIYCFTDLLSECFCIILKYFGLRSDRLNQTVQRSACHEISVHNAVCNWIQCRRCQSKFQASYSCSFTEIETLKLKIFMAMYLKIILVMVLTSFHVPDGIVRRDVRR